MRSWALPSLVHDNTLRPHCALGMLTGHHTLQRHTLTLSIIAASAPDSIVTIDAGRKVGEPHCNGYGMYTQGASSTAWRLSVRQLALRFGDVLSYTPAAVKMPNADGRNQDVIWRGLLHVTLPEWQRGRN